MKVSTYQLIYNVTESVHIDDVDKAAYTVCHSFGLSTDKVDKMSPKQFLTKIDKAAKLLQKSIHPLWYSTKLNTDASTITLGQFIETIHWMKGGVIESLHLIAATMMHGTEHAKDAQVALKSNIRHILPFVLEYIESINALVKSYEGLFDSDEPIDPTVKPEPPHPFVDRYGWIFSARQVADFEGITMDQAYDLPIMQALNDLSYLKSKQQYEKNMSK